MKSSSAWCIVGLISWIVTALAAIHLGLLPFGHNIFSSGFLATTSPDAIRWVHYLIGICGVISLVMLFMKFNSGHKCKC